MLQNENKGLHCRYVICKYSNGGWHCCNVKFQYRNKDLHCRYAICKFWNGDWMQGIGGMILQKCDARPSIKCHCIAEEMIKYVLITWNKFIILQYQII